MADGDTYIDLGATLSIALGKPATLDATGFAAKSYTQIKGILNIPENGDTAEDVSEPTLADGRTEHFYGTKDGGGIDISFKYIEGDAGQALILPGVDRDVNAVWSFKIEDSDGTITYKYGRIGPVRRSERRSNTFKGYNMPIMFNSAEVVA